MYKVSLDETDYLQYQLFNASISPRLRRKRNRTWLTLVFCSLFLSWLFYVSDNPALTYYFLFVAGVTLLFYPLYQRGQYKRHYLKHIQENYRNRFNIETQIGFADKFLISYNDSTEGKVKLSELEEINETAKHLFIKIRTGETLVIPKDKLDIDRFEEELKRNIDGLNVRWNKKLNWKWK